MSLQVGRSARMHAHSRWMKPEYDLADVKLGQGLMRYHGSHVK